MSATAALLRLLTAANVDPKQSSPGLKTRSAAGPGVILSLRCITPARGSHGNPYPAARIHNLVEQYGCVAVGGAGAASRSHAAHRPAHEPGCGQSGRPGPNCGVPSRPTGIGL